MMERAVLLKTNSLARPFDSYPIPYLQALLLYGEEAQAELNKIARAEPDEDIDWLFQPTRKAPPTRRGPSVQGPPKKALPKPTSYDEPILTGDPVADEWERAIARGEMPEL